MRLLLNLTIWSCVTLVTTCNLTDLDWTSLLPFMESVCPSVDVCGRNVVDTNNVLVNDKNACCLGCSCERDCSSRLEGCCFDGDDHNGSMITCLKAATIASLPAFTYKFITCPPISGCEGQHTESSCDADVKVAPWGNFYPVYSKSLKMNFKNKPCALCHGCAVTDLAQWTPVLGFMGSHRNFLSAIEQFSSTYNSAEMGIVFLPPNEESGAMDKRCFEVIEHCPYEDFTIPSSVQLDKAAVIKACVSGPRALYVIQSSLAYKNVYCSICNGFAEKEDTAFQCADVDPNRSITALFNGLLAKGFVKPRQQHNPTDSRTHGPCYRPIENLNGSSCVQSTCPTFQVRSYSGECEYFITSTSAECFKLFLKLSPVTHTIVSGIENMTQSRVLSLFEEMNHWPDVWKISSIFMLDGLRKAEFIVEFSMKTTQRFSLPRIVRDITENLSKMWYLRLGDEMHFTQTLVAWNRWKGNVVTLYTTRAYLARFCPEISKLFFCHQLELQSGEFRHNSSSLLYIMDGDITLYVSEYALMEAEDGTKTVRVCAEDSGYVRIDAARGAAGGSYGTIYVPILMAMLLTVIPL